MSDIQKLREKREVARNTMLQLRDKIVAEDRDFSNDERASFDAASKDYDDLGRRVDALAKCEGMERSASDNVPGLEDTLPKRQKGGAGRRAERIKAENLARGAWFSHKAGRRLTSEEIRACKAVGFNPKNDEISFPALSVLKRDLSVVTNTAGEHTIAEGFVNSLEKSLLAHGRVRLVADVMTTAGGEPLPWPTVSDHGNAAELLAENTAAAEADPTFGAITFNAYKLSSKMVQVPNELMQDSAFDIASLLGMLLGERLARTENTYFTTGTGSSQPAGIITGASSGKTTAVATSITMDEIIDLMHSVDPDYRSDPSAAWMMHDNIAAYVRKLKDGSSRYLWEPAVTAGQPDRLFNYPVHINQQMASAVTTGQKTILFGAMKKFKIRQAGGVRLVRLNERFAEADQTAFIAFSRVDSRVLDAGTDPLKFLTQA